MLDPAMQNPTSQVRHLDYIIIVKSVAIPTATKTTATPWSSRVSPSHAMGSSTVSQFRNQAPGCQTCGCTCHHSHQTNSRTMCDMSSCDLWTFSHMAVGTDSNTPENWSEIPNKIEDPQITSYGIIQDPALQSLALALPFCPDRQEKLLRAVYLEDWVKYTNIELEPAQKLHSHLLFTIMDPHYPPLNLSR